MSKSELPSPDPDGSLTTGRDRVADFQARLAAAERRERQLRQIIDLVPDLAFSSDAEGRYLLESKALADVYGIEVDEVCKRRKQDLTPDPELGKRLVEEDLAVLRCGEPSFVPELEVRDANGFVNDRWALVRTGPTSDGGPMVGYTDITGQKAAERVRR